MPTAPYSTQTYVVSYNGQQPWITGSLGISGIPFVSVDNSEVFLAGRIGTIRTATLNGTIPSGGVEAINLIKNAFSANFKAFSAPNIYMPNASIQEISFGSQNYLGKVDYTIILKDFSGFLYGVNDPVDEVSFQEEQDGSVTVSHKVSAIGLSNTLSSETAFNNASGFVNSRTGIHNVLAFGASFISTENSGNIFLLSQQEQINRTLGLYAITETFKYDPLRDTSNSVFKRFSLELNSGIQDDYAQVLVNGTYIGGKDIWDDKVLQQITASDFFTLASAVLNDINSTPLSFNIETEELSQSQGGVPKARIANAKAVYDNSPSASFFDYNLELNTDYRTQITQLNIQGIILGSGRHVRRRYDSALAFYNNVIGGWVGIPGYLYRGAISGLSDFNYNGWLFNPSPKSLGANFNSGQGIITINASFDDAPFVSGYSEFTWSANADCGLNIFKPHASANQNGSYVVQDFNILNRTQISLNGNFAFPSTGSFYPREAINILTLLKSLEGTSNAFLESETYNNSSGEVMNSGFNISYSKDGKNLSALPDNGKIYAGINI